MTLQDAQIDYIKKAFSNVKSKEELLELLNYVKSLLFKDKVHPFTIRQINFYRNSNRIRARYTTFDLLKKSGATRTIHAPVKGLKVLQKCILIILETIAELNPAATGFRKGTSIVQNAMLHTGQRYVYNIDLKDFFPSIDQARIWGRLQHAPFNLNPATNRLELANIIAGICCQKMIVERLNDDGEWKNEVKSVLPQGACTSPLLSNIICQHLDKQLYLAAKRHNIQYSRYADDITFSCNRNMFSAKRAFIKEIGLIIKNQKFHINTSKVRLQKKENKQEVTGLIVNEKVNVSTQYIKELRMWLYYWDRYGLEKASSYFLPKYIESKQHIFKDYIPEFAAVIKGKLNFLKMVKGELDPTYTKLNKKFIKLAGDKGYMTSLLTLWEKEGLENAMSTYYKVDNSQGS